LVADHIKTDKGGNMNTYNYELNTLFNDGTYDELLEIYNNFDFEIMLNESVLSIPKNKIKDMLKKISTIKDTDKMEKFVNKNKKFVKPEKELKQRVRKLAKQLNFEEKEVKQAEISIIKTLAAISQFSTLVSLLGIPLLIIMMINAKVKRQTLSDVSHQIIKDIKDSIQKAKKGPYTSSLNFTVFGVLFYIGSILIYFLTMFTAGFATTIMTSFVGGALFVGMILLILSMISFMWTFLGTPGRMRRGEN